MQDLLFLCHRLPYPPDKGDKIRSYHVLRYLASRYRIHLGTFVDDPADWQHVEAVKVMCAETCIRPLPPWRSRLRALTSIFDGLPLTANYYRDQVMQQWVRRQLATGKIHLAVGYSSAMARFLMHTGGVRLVMDFVDVDSDKWRQYADSHTGMAHWLYQREARRLADYERDIATRFDASLFVSAAEAEFFRRRVPDAAARIHGISNGVDTDYWKPGLSFANPYKPGNKVVVFVGAMDYWANAQAAQWFARDIWPGIHRALPDARFYIVGSRPTTAVRALGATDGVVVTGRVEDVRPFVMHAHAVATPLRIARGIQNKVLEALAMGKVLLATPQAYEGIEDFDGRVGCVSDDPATLVASTLQALQPNEPINVDAARLHMTVRYTWSSLLKEYADIVSGAPIPVHGGPAGRHSLGMESCT